jgi:hypothetical protein
MTRQSSTRENPESALAWLLHFAIQVGSKWVVEPSYSDLEEEEPCIVCHSSRTSFSTSRRFLIVPADPC